MKVEELKKYLETIPEDASVAYKSYENDERIALVFAIASDLYQIYIEPYKGLPIVDILGDLLMDED